MLRRIYKLKNINHMVVLNSRDQSKASVQGSMFHCYKSEETKKKILALENTNDSDMRYFESEGLKLSHASIFSVSLTF